MADPEFRAASASVTVPGNVGGSATLNAPAGMVDGDYLFIVCVTPNTSGADAAPSGFGSPLITVASNAYRGGVRIFGRVASSEPSTYSVAETVSGSTGRCFSIAYSSPGGTPINASASATDFSTSSPPVPGLTTSAAGKLIGFTFECSARNTTITAAGAMTLRTSHATDNRSFGWADEDIATTGSITGRALSSSVSGDFHSVAILLTAGGGGGGSSTGAAAYYYLHQ